MRVRIEAIVFTAALGGVIGCSTQNEAPPSAQVTERTSAIKEKKQIPSQFLNFKAPAGDQPAATQATIDGRSGAILPNGRFVTPLGVEVSVQAPKPFGMTIARDGKTAATINSGASRFSVTLIRDLLGPTPTSVFIPVDATFMGIVFSADGTRFYASGGEDGLIWVGDVAAGQIIGSVNLNSAAHALNRPLVPTTGPSPRFKGSFPGNLTLSADGRYLYVVDQGSFQVHSIDTTAIAVGVDATGGITEPDNFAAVVGHAKTGRYPFGISLSADQGTLLVSNVGTFQYTHLRPEAPVGDNNADYPLCIPGVGYPDEVLTPKTIVIKKIDASTISGLPTTQRDPDGIRCGYIPATRSYTIPALGSPNAPEASSLYAYSLADRSAPALLGTAKTGPLVGDREDGIAAFSGSHPNAVTAGNKLLYVSNGNNDSIAVLEAKSLRKVGSVALSVLSDGDARLKGVQPVDVTLSPDQKFLYVAEAGINAVGVVRLEGNGRNGKVIGLLPTGWWPSAVEVSADGRTLYVASAKGRGAGPNTTNSAPKHSVFGTFAAITIPERNADLAELTRQVLRNNGFLSTDKVVVEEDRAGDGREGNDGPIPSRPGVASKQIKHVVFINKENATHDLLLGDIVATRGGVPVNGNPAYSLGPAAAPNHHELALAFSFGDNFYLEPSVSSDGHRWLTNTYTTEFEETHWPASYGGRRNDSGDNPEIVANYPGRIGFTDADGSPEPNDYNQHGGIYLHLDRNGKSFVNFGNGFEFALVDEDSNTEPTGIREHANVPMEKVVRDNTDHLYPEYNTHIPDAPLPENPDRFNRFGRFKQVFESQYVDRASGKCNLPSYVDLYYPNDHGGGANDINPKGPAWDYTRFVQDNDAALGMTVDLISKSPCWKDTVIFVVEDDTQNGLDHVDGYRSIFLAISPWVKREHVTKRHISLASIFKTVDLIFGMPPLNQYDAAATDLRELFTSQADFTPYDFRAPAYVAHGKPAWKRLTRGINFGRPDADEVKLRLAIMKSEGVPRRGHAKHAATANRRAGLRADASDVLKAGGPS